MSGREILRDKYGIVLGEIRIDGSKQTLWDSHFNRLGEYDAHQPDGDETETQWAAEIC